MVIQRDDDGARIGECDDAHDARAGDRVGSYGARAGPFDARGGAADEFEQPEVCS